MTDIRPLPVALAALALLSAGCSTNVSVAPDALPTPSIVAGSPITTCTASGTAATVTLSAVGTSVTENFSALPPRDRVVVRGTATGLGPADELHVVIVPIGSSCPVVANVVAAVGADGRFTATLDTDGLEDFRIAAFTLPGDSGPIVGCATAEAACLDTSGVAPTGMADTLEIRLR